ncbi:hypothetical protein H9P43_004296 [Blastocladiella emersonii ATCC 22665]|nr:hypothetical protein H9P43_004296 [Blastocladiella emersonii ATCC 22665]
MAYSRILSTVLVVAYLATAVQAAPAAANTDNVYGATIAVDGGLLVALFNQRAATGLPANMFDVLGGGAKPESVTEALITSYGIPAGLNLTYSIKSKAVEGNDCKTGGNVWDKASRASATPKDKDWASYLTGDLAGKYGALSAANNLKKLRVIDPTYQVSDLKGLSLHVSDATGAFTACSNLVSMSVGDVSAAAASMPVTVVIPNTKGAGELMLQFMEIPTDGAPDAVFAPVGNPTPRPAKVVRTTVTAINFPSNATYKYHIHESAITGTNCSTALDHWDPLKANPRTRGGVTTDYKPTPGNWSTYELGDLSGKYGSIGNGTITAPAANLLSKQQQQTSINGVQVSVSTFVVADPALTKLADFINLSVVLHDSTSARVGCSNIYAPSAVSSLPAVAASGSVPNVNVADALVGAGPNGSNSGTSAPAGASSAAAPSLSASSVAVAVVAALAMAAAGF